MYIALATVQVPFVEGGAEVLTRNLAQALRAAGHLVEIVAIPFKWYPPERMLDCMLACRLLDITQTCGRPIDRMIGLKFPAYFLPHPNKVHWLLHQHRQAYEQWDGPFSDLIHFGNGREVRDAIRLADTRLLPEARAIYTISQNVSNRLQRFNGLDSSPVYHPPGDAELLYCEDAEDFFYFPSRINAVKRQLLAVQALALLPGTTKLLFSGASEDEANYDAIIREIKRAGLADRVKFLGRVDEVEKRRLYATCLGVIYPPVDEDYGYVTLEAMLSSKPVVTCTDSGGTLEFVQDGVQGCVTEPTPAALAEGMARLIGNRAAAAAMGRAGRDAYLQMKISWSAVVEKLLA